MLLKTERSIVRAMRGIQLKDRSKDLVLILVLKGTIDQLALDFEAADQRNEGR